MNNKTYKIEEMFLSEFATFSNQSKGRERAEEPCLFRTDFQRDRDRIIHSKAFRRLKNKTQVFLRPVGDHFRTRITHTLDVAQVARSIARILNLNEDLTEAIALSHDLGHTPFGHAGERALCNLTGGEFSHVKQGIRVVEFLENDGRGLNLTYEVRDGILNHNSSGKPNTLEGKIVHLADRIAYLNHDIDDAIRAGVINITDIPKELIETLGKSHSKRIDRMITSIYTASNGTNDVKMTQEVSEASKALRKFMFQEVYFSKDKRDEENKVEVMIELLFNYYKKDMSKLPEFYRNLAEKYGDDTVICDYISTMTDSFVLAIFQKAFVPETNF